eukprot:m.87017 g.87017  ORF g.87017 m.87017 type:complete len:714 (-) comp14488_c0_seq1:1253-3394(-)
MVYVNLLDLPQELLEHILSFLDLSSLYATALQCRTLNSLRWKVMDMRSVALHRLTEENFRYIIAIRRPEVLLMSGVLGCPRSAIPSYNLNAIAKGRSLRHLSLEAAYMGDECLVLLADIFPYLKHLNLRFNNISPKGASTLAEALLTASHLQSLDISCNPLKDGISSICKSLANAQHLRRLKVVDAHLRDSDCIALADLLIALPTLESLDLSMNQLCDQGMLALSKGLAVCSNMATLNLKSIRLGSEGLLSLGEAIRDWPNKNLRELVLSDNLITHNIGCLGAGLGQQTAFQRLCLSGNSFQEMPTLCLHRMLAGCGGAVVQLNRCQITVAGCNDIASALSGGAPLTGLYLSSNSCGSDGMLALGRAVAINMTLTLLNLNDNQLGDEGMVLLCAGLRQNHSLSSLFVADNGCDTRGFRALAEYIQTTTTLTELDISGNMLDEVAAAALGQAVAHNTSIHTLVMGSMYIYGAVMSAFASGFDRSVCKHANTSLRMLNLSSNDIMEDGAEAVAQLLLRDTTSLESLDLSGNSLGDEGVRTLARAIHTNTRLLHLNLCNNGIGQEGAFHLAQALDHGTSSLLQRLDLSKNRLGNEGTRDLCKGIRLNRHIKALSLADNGIALGGAEALGALLGLNRSLEALSLEDNPLQCDAVYALTAGLQSNTHLREINIKNIAVDSSACVRRPETVIGVSNRRVRVLASQQKCDLSEPPPLRIQ